MKGRYIFQSLNYEAMLWQKANGQREQLKLGKRKEILYGASAWGDVRGSVQGAQPGPLPKSGA